MTGSLLSIAKIFAHSLKFKFKHLFTLPARPRYINLSFTYICNSRCLMCDNWKRYKDEPKKRSEELKLKDYEKFFSENDYWLSDLRNIGIAGGEPFLRSDLVDLVKLIHKNFPKIKIGLQSNGLAPQKTADVLRRIIKFYPDISLGVSLDGIGKTHDKIRGISGAYKKVLQTISEAKKAGVKEINSGMTIVADNFSEILEVKETVEKEKVKFACFLADEGEYYNKQSKNGLDEKVKNSVIKSLKEFSGDYYLDNLRLQLEGKRKRHLSCYSGWTSLVIDPYGEVRPCVLRSDSFGNIKNSSLSEILTGSKAKEIRQKIKKCFCWSICEATTSAIVDPWDVLVWFLFYAEKKKFLENYLKSKVSDL